VSTRPGARQFPLPFDHRSSLGGEDFLLAPCNREAVAWIDRWPDWPGPALVIVGARAAGKTHLASVLAARSGGQAITVTDLIEIPPAELAAIGTLILDDAEGVVGSADAEQGLFHLLNHLAASPMEGGRGRLLMTAIEPPARWGVGLRDLASRLNAAPVATIGAPDDPLIGALLVKLFADRQVRLSAEVIPYLVARMERSFDAARALVAALDARALAEGRAVSIALARAVMGEDQD
jgi:chromosomal replication initiation ATPase DnaA